MTELVFDCVDVRAERWAAAPTVRFRLKVSETSGARIHAVALRCQLRIEPQRRRYSDAEAERLLDLFGERSRWGETLKPLQFAELSVMLPGFQGSTEADLPVPCTYDFEVASAKYFDALSDGEVPLLLLFSGTVFTRGRSGVMVERVPWDKEAACRMPVRVWREAMELHFPGTAWIRVRRETFEALHRFKSHRALPTWDDALEALLEGAEESTA
ncbi:MAG TPA: DUF6084 family protein [Actinomycetes bacterium]